MSINSVAITGNLTRDPELRETASGMQILAFGVAVNERRKNQQTGEWEDYANFVDCTMFGNRAEAVAKYLEKGSKVAVEGRLRWSSWERDGERRSKLEVVVDGIEFMGPRRQSEPESQPPRPAPQPQGGYAEAYRRIREGEAPAPVPQPQASVYDEDIPF